MEVSQSYKSSTDPQSTPGTSGVVTYSHHNGIDATFFRSTGEVKLLGAIKFDTEIITASTTLVNYNSGQIIGNSTSNIVATLPNAEEGLYFSFTNIGAGSLTINTYSTDQTIHNDTSFELYTDENLSLSSKNSNWYLI